MVTTYTTPISSVGGRSSLDASPPGHPVSSPPGHPVSSPGSGSMVTHGVDEASVPETVETPSPPNTEDVEETAMAVPVQAGEMMTYPADDFPADDTLPPLEAIEEMVPITGDVAVQSPFHGAAIPLGMAGESQPPVVREEPPPVVEEEEALTEVYVDKSLLLLEEFKRTLQDLPLRSGPAFPIADGGTFDRILTFLTKLAEAGMWSFAWLILRSIDWLIECLTAGLIDWLIGWSLVGRSMWHFLIGSAFFMDGFLGVVWLIDWLNRLCWTHRVWFNLWIRVGFLQNLTLITNSASISSKRTFIRPSRNSTWMSPSLAGILSRMWVEFCVVCILSINQSINQWINHLIIQSENWAEQNTQAENQSINRSIEWTTVPWTINQSINRSVDRLSSKTLRKLVIV